MAKLSFTAVGEVYNIIKRLGNADHIIGDETTKAANTPIAAAIPASRYRICPPITVAPPCDQLSSDAFFAVRRS
jgi:hypothetical protein